MNEETRFDIAMLILNVAEYVRMHKSIATDRINPSEELIKWASVVSEGS